MHLSLLHRNTHNNSKGSSYHPNDNSSLSWTGQTSRKMFYYKWDQIKWILDLRNQQNYCCICAPMCPMSKTQEVCRGAANGGSAIGVCTSISSIHILWKGPKGHRNNRRYFATRESTASKDFGFQCANTKVLEWSKPPGLDPLKIKCQHSSLIITFDVWSCFCPQTCLDLFSYCLLFC